MIQPACKPVDPRKNHAVAVWLCMSLLCIALSGMVLSVACGSGSTTATSTPTPPTNPPAPTPPAPTPPTPAPPTPTPPTPPAPNPVKANYVVLVVLENANYASVVGSANAPYLNSLIPQGALATNYFANTHPSIGNYFMLTTGNIVTNDDAYAGDIIPPELASALTGAGKSWKVYAEGIPAAGYTGDNTGAYLKRHNPFSYFTDVAGTPAADNIVPFSQLATDAAGTLSNFTMIVGNIYDVGHNCLPTVTNCTEDVEVAQADAWLKTTLPQILSNTAFQGSGLLVVTVDESEDDNTNGGGQVPTVLLGTNVKAGYSATGLYQHQSLLRLMLEAQNITAFPNLSATAPTMAEIWK